MLEVVVEVRTVYTARWTSTSLRRRHLKSSARIIHFRNSRWLDTTTTIITITIPITLTTAVACLPFQPTPTRTQCLDRTRTRRTILSAIACRNVRDPTPRCLPRPLHPPFRTTRYRRRQITLPWRRRLTRLDYVLMAHTTCTCLGFATYRCSTRQRWRRWNRKRTA